jgi:hypothetical protein
LAKSGYNYSYLNYVIQIDSKLKLKSEDEFAILAKELLKSSKKYNKKTQEVIVVLLKDYYQYRFVG